MLPPIRAKRQIWGRFLALLTTKSINKCVCWCVCWCNVFVYVYLCVSACVVFVCANLSSVKYKFCRKQGHQMVRSNNASKQTKFCVCTMGPNSVSVFVLFIMKITGSDVKRTRKM